MSNFCHRSFLRVLFYLCWTTGDALSQDLNDRDAVGGGQLTSSYFFYQRSEYPRDCADVREQCSPANLSGVHLIKPDGYPEPFEVYCENAVDSGGWTVIYRRSDGSVDFNRNWLECTGGFGFLSGEYWIGNEKLSHLTNQKTYELRIDITSSDSFSFYITYNSFRISDEFSSFKLSSVGEYHGSEDDINTFMCSPNTDGDIYISPNCATRCFCTGGHFSCIYNNDCSPNAVCEERNGVNKCYCNPGYTGDGQNCILDSVPTTVPTTAPIDCLDVYNRGSTEDGVYLIKPNTWNGLPFEVYCNMTDGGGWTVFQRRVDGTVDFYLYWADYKAGFGNASHESWLGNDKLQSLTNQRNYELRIDFVNRYGSPYYAKFSSFNVSDETNNYRLNLGTYSEGDAGDSLTYHNGQAFTTRDRDNDNYNYNCASNYNGAWWYNACAYSSLNSPYGSYYFYWYRLPGDNNYIQYTEMKLHPV
ncbi:Fibrinogen-like protein A [Holothuria leucospilota]|uniref:Fibrinogen-like protein A n=1 Tax=Holothuria leucospilota TaxID=206669 RepID=A0A9Q1BW91_HOLLE|nr:Fibrinogen-like protein A [Holothuria leucospilota]